MVKDSITITTLVLQKEPYMKNSVKLVLFHSIVIFSFFFTHSVFAQQKTVTVKGVVTDQSSNAIAEALIVLFELENMQEPDSAFSKTDGSFEKQITVSENAKMISYAIAKQGYKLAAGAGIILANKVNIGKVKLEEAGSDSITVSGTVIDSITQQGIANAQIIISVASMIPTLADTLYTNDNGSFSRKMPGSAELIAGTIKPMVLCRISKDEYHEKTVVDTIVDVAVDLGSIVLHKKNSSIFTTKMIPLHGKKLPNTVTVYSVQGKLLFHGKPDDFVSDQRLSIFAHQLYLFKYSYDSHSFFTNKCIIYE